MGVERLEAVHETTLEAARSAVANAWAQDRHEIDGKIATFRSEMQQAIACQEEIFTEIRQSLHLVDTKVTLLGSRPEESSTVQELDQRCNNHERRISEIQARFDAIPPMEEVALAAISERKPKDLEDLHTRLACLEGQMAADNTRKTQKKLYELVEQVSQLAH